MPTYEIYWTESLAYRQVVEAADEEAAKQMMDTDEAKLAFAEVDYIEVKEQA